jgi:EmrB/QacA subfamily drug resistance transporter
LTIIVTTFHGQRLPKAIGAWSAVAGAGGAVGGLLGGVLTGWFSWRWVFFINVPFGIIAAIVAALYLRELRNRDATVKLDVTGAVLITSSLASIIYGVVNTPTEGWGSTTTLSWIIGGAVALVAFLFWESNVASHPLVPFRIFKSRALSSANIVMFLVGGAFFAMWYFLTFYFQYILGYDPVRAGVAFLPMAIGIILGAQISSRLLVKTGARPILLAGGAIATLGFLWISLIRVDSSYWGSILIPSVLCSFAMGLLFSPLANTATAGVDRADAGLASGVLNTARQVGGSLALAILGTVAADRTATFMNPTSGLALVSGYQRVFEVSALITFVALLASLAVPRGTGLAAKH